MSIRDEMVRCPFDENHRVSRARFPVHLIKCRKQHKNKNFSICPFNATHYVLTPEFQFHMENCPDRKERDLAAALSDHEDQPSTRGKDIPVPPPSEIWGNDGEDVISYLEVKDQLIAKLPILRAPSGMTKSERKRFMRREIHRFHNLGKDQASSSKGFNNDSDSGQEDGQIREEEEEEEEEEEQEEGRQGHHNRNDHAAGKKATGKEAQGYEAEDDEERGAVGGKQENGGEFSVVKRKKKKKKKSSSSSSSVKQGAEENGGKPSSDKKKNHGRKHH